NVLTDALNLIDHASGLNRSNPVFHVTLALAHPDLDRLVGHRLVGKDPNPQLAATLDVSSHRPSGRFDLTCRDETTRGCLQAVLAEADAVTHVRQPAVTPFLLLSELGTFRLQHRLALLARAALGRCLFRTLLGIQVENLAL